MEVLKGHYAPRPSVITQRYKFNTRIRQQGESVSTYVAELKAIAEFCDFSNLEQMLRDQLVCGIADLRIQKRLLQDAALTYKTALETALSMEMANKDATQLQRPGPPSTTVNAVQHRGRVIDVVVITHKSHADLRWLSAITVRRQAILRQSAAAVPKLLTKGRTTLPKHKQAVQILNRADVGPRSIKRSIKRALLRRLITAARLQLNWSTAQ